MGHQAPVGSPQASLPRFLLPHQAALASSYSCVLQLRYPWTSGWFCFSSRKPPLDSPPLSGVLWPLGVAHCLFLLSGLAHLWGSPCVGRGYAALLRHWGSAPQCSSLYEERYVLPSQTLNSQGSSPVQETHPLLGEWKVSSPPPVHIHTHTHKGLPWGTPTSLWALLSSSSDPLILILGSWEELAIVR